MVDFFNVLTGEELLARTEALLPEHRERCYPPTVTLAMFLKQALSADRSCQRAVDGWAARQAAQGLKPASVRTGAYCRARKRLPCEMVRALARCTGAVLAQRARGAWRWRGRCVKLADGTGLLMPDTGENQASFPQPSSQAAGVGLPMTRVVAVICLSTGAVLEAAYGPLHGKGEGELSRFRELLGTFSAGDVVLGDALYCNYFTIAALTAAGVDVLFEQHGARRTDFRRGETLGARDHLVHWSRPRRPQWMSPEYYESFHAEITVREARVDGRVLVTTMLDAHRVSKSELDRLYGCRWHVELDLRNIKTTLGLEMLSCKSPAMVEKELWVYLLAYNLVRLLMAQAAREVGVAPRQISFKHTVQLWIAWSGEHLADRPETAQASLFRMIGQLRVGNRPGRIEPRARKRRPKSFPWLKVPRDEARRQLRIHNHLLCA